MTRRVSNVRKVVVSGSFDDLRSRHVRLLEEASKLGALHVLLWSDETVLALDGKPPAFPEQERQYLLQSLRYVHSVSLARGLTDPDQLPDLEHLCPHVWVVAEF